MKKTINNGNNKIIKFIRKIVTFFDKWVITPITKLIMIVTDFIKDNSHNVERFIANKQTLIVISLICALIMFFIVDQKSNLLIDRSADILYGQKVTAIYDSGAYVVEGLPKTIDITLVGRKNDIYLAKQYPAKEVSVDLRGLKPGSHRVNLKYKQAISSIDYKLDPSAVTVVIYEKISETRELTADVLHKDSLDSKLNISSIELSRNDVIIKGAAYKLKQVATVKALVDINNISSQKAGVVTLESVPLVAYDSTGNIVDVEIVPSSVDAKVTITSPSKELPIKIVPKGDLAFGKSIKSLTSSIGTIVVYGDENTVNSMEYFPVEINVKDLDKDKKFNVNLKKPAGIRELSTKTIVVDLALDDLVTREIEDVMIVTKNLGAGYTVNALGEEYIKITVVVKGSKSVVDTITPSSINAYIDLSGYTEGQHEVDIKVSGDDLRVKYAPKIKKAKVIITK